MAKFRITINIISLDNIQIIMNIYTDIYTHYKIEIKIEIET